MNKLNLYKQLGAFALTMIAICFTLYVNIDFYKFITLLIGSYQIGSFSGKYSRNKWPLYEKKNESC